MFLEGDQDHWKHRKADNDSRTWIDRGFQLFIGSQLIN